MKKTYVLLSLILTTVLFAQEKSELSSTKTTYFLEGTIANKYPITMYLTIEENTKKVEGQYYYNNNKTPIYLGESVLDKNLTLKEYTNSYPDTYKKENSTGEFVGKLDKKMVFTGTWSNGKNSFDFEVKPNKAQIVQEIQIKKYSFKDSFNTDPESPAFDFAEETFQIANPKKLAGINKINKELGIINELNADYSYWKENPDELRPHNMVFDDSYEFVYRDNTILSINNIGYCYAGGAHGNTGYRPIVYSLDKGQVLNEKVSDLVYSIEDEKLITLLRKKLIEQMKERYSDEDNSIDEIKQGYFNFETIRLNDYYGVDALGINFVYTQYEIASYAAGIIIVPFTYEELKPFVKKDSKLYYLFE